MHTDRMSLIPFPDLMNWIMTEKKNRNSVFGVHSAFKAGNKTLPIFKEKIETPFGPAAGPNTQLSQNIVAAYYAGSRFFELKTVDVYKRQDQRIDTILDDVYSDVKDGDYYGGCKTFLKYVDRYMYCLLYTSRCV